MAQAVISQDCALAIRSRAISLTPFSSGHILISPTRMGGLRRVSAAGPAQNRWRAECVRGKIRDRGAPPTRATLAVWAAPYPNRFLCEEQQVDLLQRNEARCAWANQFGWPKDVGREPIAAIAAP